jgi:glycosyltransferase involved in cell wall biosynthesis
MDFDKYEFTFVGRSPIKWKNINNLGLKGPYEIEDILSDHDIFITASKNDPCSNALIEAMSVGLPVLALNSGGHPEIVGANGILFDGEDDVLDKLNRLVLDYDIYVKNVKVDSMAEVAKKYLVFFESLI